MSSISDWYAGLRRELSRRDCLARRELLPLTYAATDRGETRLGYLGRTWVERGAGYWSRRLAMTFVYFVLALFLGLLTLGIGPDLLFSHRYSFNAQLPPIVKILILVVWYVPAALAYLVMYRSLVLYGYRRDRLQSRMPTGFMAGRLLMPLVFPFLSIAGGMIVAMFTATLRAQFPGEAAAREGRRLYLEEQQQRDKKRKRKR